jgi:hypothetical protein
MKAPPKGHVDREARALAACDGHEFDWHDLRPSERMRYREEAREELLAGYVADNEKAAGEAIALEQRVAELERLRDELEGQLEGTQEERSVWEGRAFTATDRAESAEALLGGASETLIGSAHAGERRPLPGGACPRQRDQGGRRAFGALSWLLRVVQKKEDAHA